MRSSYTGNYLPRNVFKVVLGRFVLWLLKGWVIEGTFPENLNKYVMIVAHHTSNWDFVVGVGVKLVTRIRVHFFAKKSLFVWPLSLVMRRLGGIPIERSQSVNRVDRAVIEITQRDHFVLLITPEGTRSKVRKWKTGFYYIANGANIPVVPVALNYRSRKVVIGAPLAVTGDIRSDLEKLHLFFLPHPGKYPELGCNGPFEPPDVCG